MTLYTIVRNGVIHQQPRGPHKCGFNGTIQYPYRVELTVKGTLRPPNYFIVANEAIHEAVIDSFKAKPSTSCEKMCDDICGAVRELMARRENEHWLVERIHVELTGTNGKALLSCDWQRGRP